ncbi:MAG: DNA repair exonuclease [Candidatus Pacearchaeota archaeon]
MVRFAHMADLHLGGWKQQPLQDLNLESFKKAIELCILERVEFVVIAGDIFDSAFPPIDILKETFAEFRRLKEAGIPCFIIAGSHDYSVSGKTFLDVLEKSGFCKNVEDHEEKEGNLILNPTIHKNVAIYGYPGKTSGMELADLKRAKLNDSPGLFKIFMLHTTIDKAKGSIPVEALETDKVPKADYYAMGHLHIDFQYENFVYPGPIFPNNFQELEDLNYGRFCIVDSDLDQKNMVKRIEIKIKEVVPFEIEINNALHATEKIISEFEKKDLEDKIIVLRLKGTLESGKKSDIKFSKIEEAAERQKAYFLLRNTHDLKVKESDFEFKVEDTDNIENETIGNYLEQNPSEFNKNVSHMMKILSTERQEGETSESFTKRIIDESRKVFDF